METGCVVAILAVLAAGVYSWWVQEQRVRQAQEERGRAWAAEDRWRERVEELERQVDELHGQGLVVPPEPGSEPESFGEGVEIPDPVERWIDAGGFDEETEREFRMYAAHKVRERPELANQPEELLEAIRG